MSRRGLVAVGAVAGLGALVTGALVALGSAPTSVAGTDVWSGWTGRVDDEAVADRAAMTPDDAVAVDLLSRAATAASSVAYTGRAVTWDGGGTTSMDLTHVPGRGTIWRTVGSSRAQLAPDGRSGSFADDGRPLALLRENYRVLREADLDTTVAGRPTEAVVAVGTDGVVDARYWLDAATGLLLRRELLDVKGLVRSRTGFVTFHLGVPAGTVVPTPARDPWSDPLDGPALAAARDAGCACPEALPGGLDLLDARRAPAGTVSSTPVVHELFSDGVATVSLFSLTGDLSSSDTDGLRARGFAARPLDGYTAWVRGGTPEQPAVTVVWVCHGHVLTLVTDDAQDPLGTAASVVAAFPPTGDGQGTSLLARLERGWQRLVGSRS